MQETVALGGNGDGQDEDSDDARDLGAQEQASLWPCCPPYFIQENGEFRKYWEIIIIFLALYNAAVIPLQLFFTPNPHIIDNDMIRFSDAVVDLIFLIDIIFEFRTTYLDPKLGKEVKTPEKLAKRYLKGRFTIDLISSVPFNALFSMRTEFLDMLGLLKLLRVSRISPVIRKSNAPQGVKVYL